LKIQVVDVDESNLPADLDDVVTTTGSDGETITVVAGVTTPTIDDGYTLLPLVGTLTGVVFEDTDGNGIQDNGELGVSNVSVDIIDSEDNLITVVTGADGSWIATDIPVGDALVDVDESSLPANLDDAVTTIGSDEETVVVVAGVSTPSTDDGYTLIINEILPQDDVFEMINPGETAGNIFSDNGNGVDTLGDSPADITTTVITIESSDPEVVLDPLTGDVTVSDDAPEGTYTIVYTICEIANPGNCEDAIVTIEVDQPCLTVINEFSPNNDNISDYLHINCIDQYENNSIEIFNRWGNTVYKASGYNNDTVRFEGISNGRVTISALDELPVGTYFYILDLGNGAPIIKDWIYINR